MEIDMSKYRQLSLRLEYQRSPVADEVSALTAVVRPILRATLYSLKAEQVRDLRGHENIRLRNLARLYRKGDGDCGICFEYAVHDAVKRHDPLVLEKVDDALRNYCRVEGSVPGSILFGAEKAGSLELIDTAKKTLTDNSRLMYGSRGRPVNLKNHINAVAAAFRSKEARRALPHSISGLWKADLFAGYTDTDRWVGTSVKINPSHLEPARGLRIGIVPSEQGSGDVIQRKGNLVVCPLPYDGAFMEIFYRAFAIVQQFFAADARVPREVALPGPADRQVCRSLAERRAFPVTDVIEVLEPLAQPELLEHKTRPAEVEPRRVADGTIGAVVGPMPTKPQ
jgi:hypothetical protein